MLESKVFFKNLMYSHGDIIMSNPFSLVKLPPIVDKFELDYPTENDVKFLIKNLK